MKVKELIEKLKKCDPYLEVVIDFDENGYYVAEDVDIVKYDDKEKFINIKSSNEQ